jgi:putative ABC transport system ATP-binding protein
LVIGMGRNLLQYEENAGAVTGLPADVTVHCRNVVKSYGTGSAKVMALRGIDLDVYRGELLMLVGPSGCGKTTLISVVAGILDQDSGDCRVLGENLMAMGQRKKTAFRGENVGFVFQAFNLLPTLSAAENAAVPLLINGENRRRAIDKARAMLDRVGLGDRGHSLPSQLSGGQQQRVAIARALVHDPKLIVCDEPTSALDHETGHKVMELLREVAMGDGRSLVIVTHDARIFEFADRIARMDDGRIDKVVKSANELGH